MSSTLQTAPPLSSQQKLDLLAQLVRQTASPASATGRLSHGQAALWFTHQLASQSSAYHVAFSARIRSEIDEQIFQQALQFLLDRHGILRTTYSECGGVPTAYLHSEMPVDFEVISVEKKRWEMHHERLLADIRQPFDLERGPILRARLYRQSGDDHMLVLTIHHIAIDGGSLGILLQELRVVYAALRAKHPISLPPLLVTYDHYVRQQTDMLAGPKGDRLRAYWLKQLCGEVPVLELPLDRPRRAVPRHQSASHAFQLSSQLTEALGALAQREGVTLYMILLAALQILLHRYSGQDDIWVGSPIRRKQPSFRQLVGYGVNSVVMRANLSDNPTCGEFLAQVRQTVLDAIRHADYPFPLLVQHLQPQRDASHAALFQVNLVLQTRVLAPELLPCMIPNGASPQPFDFGDLVLEPYPFLRQGGPSDLGFEMAEIGTSLCGLLQYNTDLFDSATIARMAQHFTTLLEGMAAHPDERVETLPLLTAAECHQLLDIRNDTQTASLEGHCIHERIEAQVERTSDAVALVYKDHQITYEEMNRKANQLAHHLQSLGVGPEVLVGLCVTPSPDMVVGLLGILKAGGAYVALEPTYPKDRLAFMIEDSQVSLILTQEAWVTELPGAHLRLICLDADWDRIAQHKHENPICRATPDHLAYVLYTSGSTGRPKGVLVTHRGFENLAAAQSRAFDVQPDSRVFQFASLNFDASIWELIMTLSVGAQLWLRTPDALLADEAFAHQLEQQGITHITLPPSVLATMPVGTCPALQTIIVAGEACPPELAASWSPGRRFFNAYGPTEYTVCTTMREYRADGGKVSIGRPLPNTQLYVLDPQYQPVPIGVAGELYIGGIGLARGYHNQPSLTAERFVPNPFHNEWSARLYKTGDKVRYLPDGTLEFLGRHDHQVKIRGLRIELQEIEIVLCQSPEVKDAVVIAHDASSGQKQLAAYVALWNRSPASPANTDDRDAQPAQLRAALRRFLQQRLPHYMVPSIFVIVDAIPLTPNGKIDRQTLPVPEPKLTASADTMVVPRTLEEERLSLIWCQVLGLESISIHDNFFDLGGHSLQAMQLVSQVAAHLQRDIPVHALFLHPTVSDLAQVLDTFPPTPSQEHPIKAGTLAKKPPMQPSSPFTTFVRSPILPLFATGDLPPVHAAALAYLPADLVNLTSMSRDLILRDWCHDRPCVASLLETNWGRIALIVLPCWSDDLYRDPDGLTAMALEGLKLAGDIGARTVSLTGLLPSATDYSRTLTDSLADRQDWPQVSTGHATTTSAIALTIGKLLDEGGRHLEQERVGFLGLGSIGRTTLHLMLQVLPHPAEILLCDVYAKRQALEILAQTLRENVGFQGRIQIVTAEPNVPAAFYEASLIVGATNVPDILDVSHLQPGTLMVDDSAPHCFNHERAVQRFERHRDLLFTEGGMVRAPEPFLELRYVPEVVEQTLTVQQFDTLFARHDPYEIMGCTLSSLLSTRFAQLNPTVGFVNSQSSQHSYEMLKRLGVEPARLQCAGYVLPEDACRDFRRQFRGTRPQGAWEAVGSFSVANLASTDAVG